MYYEVKTKKKIVWERRIFCDIDLEYPSFQPSSPLGMVDFKIISNRLSSLRRQRVPPTLFFFILHTIPVFSLSPSLLSFSLLFSLFLYILKANICWVRNLHANANSKRHHWILWGSQYNFRTIQMENIISGFHPPLWYNPRPSFIYAFALKNSTYTYVCFSSILFSALWTNV